MIKPNILTKIAKFFDKKYFMFLYSQINELRNINRDNISHLNKLYNKIDTLKKAYEQIKQDKDLEISNLVQLINKSKGTTKKIKKEKKDVQISQKSD